MEEEEFEISLKIIVVGNGGVGKSSMIQRFCKGTYNKSYKRTIGVDFLEKEIQIQEKDVRLMLWDTAGQEEFDSLTTAYYRGAHGCIIIFSAVDKNSFEAVYSWSLKVKKECGSIPIALVENKIDRAEESVLNKEVIERIGSCLGYRLLRTSVKQNFGVKEVFDYIANECIGKISNVNSQYLNVEELNLEEVRTGYGKNQEERVLDVSGTQKLSHLLPAYVGHSSKRKICGFH